MGRKQWGLVLVVGAGVAGLEAAWVAQARGHKVSVFGAGSSYGGKTALWARLPGSDQISSVYDYQIAQGMRHGVDYEYGVMLTADNIIAMAPDCVVLATGSTPSWPRMLPAEWRNEGYVTDLRSTAEMLLEGFPRQPGTAVLFDADHTHRPTLQHS